MKEIPLTNGLYAKVDDDDFFRVVQFKWYRNKQGYAQRTTHPRVALHQFVTGLRYQDHKDRDKLNCQKANLRPATSMQNSQNQLVSRGVVKYKGVSFITKQNKFHAAIKVNKKLKYLGSFDDMREAALMYNFAAIIYFGEFAALNVIEY